MLEPNYLSGIHSGISIDQYEKIKQMDHVEVAAPIAMIGYATYNVNIQPLYLNEVGYYRVTLKETLFDGLKKQTSTAKFHFPYGDWNLLSENLLKFDNLSSIGIPMDNIVFVRTLLLAGIDPEQEANLIGLDDAIIDIGDSRYFTSKDRIENGLLSSDTNIEQINFPILINREAFIDKEVEYTIELLDLPFTREIADEVFQEIADSENDNYLDGYEGTEVETVTFTDEEAYKLMLNVISGMDIETGDLFTGYMSTAPGYEDDDSRISMINYPTPLQYDISSQDFNHWSYVYEVIPYVDKEHLSEGESYERYREMGYLYDDIPEILTPYFVGMFDPSKLDIQQDRLNEVPMETYTPPSANLVMDGSQQQLNSPVKLQPIDDPHGFLTHPPNLLTTIEAAEAILEEDPISAIRIKVSGVSELSEGSQRLIEQVAKQIEDETGLITDITLGSSPQRALTFVPGLNGEEDIGWVEQSWVDIGAAISMFRESNFGLFGLISSVMIVAIVYVFSSTHVSMLARKHDFATLLAIGWRPSQLSRLLLTESLMIGVFVSLIAWLILGLINMFGTVPISPYRIIHTGLFGLIIYALGAIIPALAVREIRPYEAMRTGEIRRKRSHLIPTRGMISMAWTHFSGKWQRNLLSVLAIALPTSLLALFLFITMRLQGTMETTLLGHHLIVKVGPVHYIAVITALLIAVLTTGEIMWQNIVERHQEMAILKAIGWRHGNIGTLILVEGLWMGIASAVIGLLGGVAMIWAIYRHIPQGGVMVIGVIGMIPVLIAVIGSILPVRKAMNISPMSGMRRNA